MNDDLRYTIIKSHGETYILCWDRGTLIQAVITLLRWAMDAQLSFTVRDAMRAISDMRRKL